MTFEWPQSSNSLLVCSFNAERNRCEGFLYGGCGGNSNRFASAEDCFATCGGEPPVSGKCQALLFQLLCFEISIYKHKKLLECGEVSFFFAADSACDRRYCSQYREIAFMEAKGCTAEYEGGSCCPTGFKCSE